MAAAYAVLFLAIVGFLDSLYITLVVHGWIVQNRCPSPATCWAAEETCESVFTTPESKILGAPNSVFGVAYYLIVIVASLLRISTEAWPFLPLLTLVSVGAAAFSVYLAWVLIFRLRTPCPLCFTAHGINLALAAIFILSF